MKNKMLFTKKSITIVVLIAGVIVCSVTASPAGPENDYTNLKVLPRNVSSKTLQSIMTDDFVDGLGVACGFCHSEQKGSHKLDYASDAKPEKEIARNMMRMTLKLKLPRPTRVKPESVKVRMVNEWVRMRGQAMVK